MNILKKTQIIGEKWQQNKKIGSDILFSEIYIYMSIHTGREGGRGGREGGREEGGREEGRKGRRWREGRGDCYTYSNIIQWHHSI